jgi:hypothetical protein
VVVSLTREGRMSRLRRVARGPLGLLSLSTVVELLSLKE